LPLADNHLEVNVERQLKDAKSMLALHRRLIALRRAEPALQTGDIRGVGTAGDVLAYVRGGRFRIVLNTGAEEARVALPPNGTVLLSTRLDRERERTGRMVALRPHEGLIVRIDNGD
jgi:alpha-glucosidase